MIEDPFVNMEDTCVTVDQDINNDHVKIIQNIKSDDDLTIIQNINSNDEINDDEINDDEINDIENNEINECVICFDPVTNASEISKFGCVHSKYMHEKCVISLRKCPLCRETPIIVETSTRRRNTWVWQEHVICFLIGCGFASVLFVSMYPMIFFNFSNYNPKVNSTMYNDTIHNDTYIHAIYI